MIIIIKKYYVSVVRTLRWRVFSRCHWSHYYSQNGWRWWSPLQTRDTFSVFRPSKVTSFEMLQLFTAANRQLSFLYYWNTNTMERSAWNLYMAKRWILGTPSAYNRCRSESFWFCMRKAFDSFNLNARHFCTAHFCTLCECNKFNFSVENCIFVWIKDEHIQHLNVHIPKFQSRFK